MTHRFTPNRSRLAIAVALLLPAAATLAQNQTHAHPTTLDRVQVTATPLGGEAEDLAHPVEVLYGDALQDRKAGNLGGRMHLGRVVLAGRGEHRRLDVGGDSGRRVGRTARRRHPRRQRARSRRRLIRG